MAKQIIINKKTMNCPKCGSMDSVKKGDTYFWSNPHSLYNVQVTDGDVALKETEANFPRYVCIECHTRFRETNEVIVQIVTDEEFTRWFGEKELLKNGHPLIRSKEKAIEIAEKERDKIINQTRATRIDRFSRAKAIEP